MAQGCNVCSVCKICTCSSDATTHRSAMPVSDIHDTCLACAWFTHVTKCITHGTYMHVYTTCTCNTCVDPFYLECLTPSEDSPRAMLSNLWSLLCPPTALGSAIDAGRSIAKSAAASLSPVSLLLLFLLLLLSASACVVTFTGAGLQQAYKAQLPMLVLCMTLGSDRT